MSVQTNIKLPERVVGSVDLSRAIRELRAIDDWLNQAAIRGSGQAVSVPKTSRTLEEIATQNGVSLLDKKQRQQLIQVLDAFFVQAPRIHMSFAVEPTAPFTKTMVVWMRANISAVILLEIGLQPSLAAGCTVRTTNKLFDMSLRHRFTERRLELIQSITEATVDTKVDPGQVASAGTSDTRTPATKETVQ